MSAPRLVVGLGNPLMGDDGVGWHVVERLRGDPRLPAATEILFAGTDLLAAADAFAGRRRVVLVDALAGEPAGTVERLDPRAGGLDERFAAAHGPSLAGSLRILAAIDPSLAALDVRLVAVAVADARFGGELSPAVAAAVPRTVDEVLRALA